MIAEAKRLARRYYALTGKPLGITAEVAEYEAARLLGLELRPAREPGFDAIGPDGRRIQIKGRCVLDASKPGQRVGRIKLDHPWDTIILVLLDHEFEPLSVYEATRGSIEEEIRRPGSKARNERGALSVRSFKRLGRLVWDKTETAPPSSGRRADG
ncbi:MAG: DUF6998 domain-containing protein [Armatimonadota bacterium]